MSFPEWTGSAESERCVWILESNKKYKGGLMSMLHQDDDDKQEELHWYMDEVQII